MVELFDILITLSKFVLIPVLWLLIPYVLKAYTIYKIFKHPEMSDEKIKYITQMVSKDKCIIIKK